MRIKSPRSSICRRLEVRTFWEMCPMDFFNSPKRLVPDKRSRRIRTFHLSLISVRVVSTGHAGSSERVFFFCCFHPKTSSSIFLVTIALLSAYFTICLYPPIIKLSDQEIKHIGGQKMAPSNIRFLTGNKIKKIRIWR